MSNIETDRILDLSADWFREKIMLPHIQRSTDLTDISKFNINPLLQPYLSAFLDGEVTPLGIAKSLVYARALGTSITTSFGQNIQSFISDVLQTAFGSTTSGIDIEFIDQVDHTKKYAQLKLGPNTINKDDVKTIHDHFSGIKYLGRTNSIKIEYGHLAVCVLYGSTLDLNSHYKSLRDKHHYSMYVGADFWHRLTGDALFYQKLIRRLASTVNEGENSFRLDAVITELSMHPRIIELANSFRR